MISKIDFISNSSSVTNDTAFIFCDSESQRARLTVLKRAQTKLQRYLKIGANPETGLTETSQNAAHLTLLYSIQYFNIEPKTYHLMLLPSL
jgi:hypothetical protein